MEVARKNKTALNFTFVSFNAFLIVLLCFFYLQSNSNLGIAIIFIPLMFEALFILTGKHRLLRKNSIVLGLIIVLYTLLTQVVLLKNSECMSFIFTIAYFLMSIIAISYLSTNRIFRYLDAFFVFAFLLLVIDTIWRFANPLQADFYTGIYFFYKFKGSGLLFVDSNNTGMVCLAILALICYLENNFGFNLRKWTFVFLVLLVLTFSRAAIIAYLVFVLFASKKLGKGFKGFCIFCIFLVGLTLIPELIQDVSTSSKLAMIGDVFNYLKQASVIEILFGIGFTNSITAIGMFTHSWLLTFTFEFGLVGFLFILLFWVYLCKESNNKAFYILGPCLLCGISYFPLLAPYIYVFIAIITVLEKRKKEIYAD